MRIFEFAAVVALVTLAPLRSAQAEQEFDLTVKDGKVTVTPKGSWHINTKYPWKLQLGDKKLGAGEFSLSEQSASVAAPKGDGELKGSICSADQCLMIRKTVAVR